MKAFKALTEQGLMFQGGTIRVVNYKGLASRVELTVVCMVFLTVLQEEDCNFKRNTCT